MSADRMRALVVVLMPANHQVDAILVEKWNPLLPDAKVSAIELVSRRNGDLMHANDNPVDRLISSGYGQLAFEPGPLSSLGIAPDVGVARVLIGDVIVGD